MIHHTLTLLKLFPFLNGTYRVKYVKEEEMQT